MALTSLSQLNPRQQSATVTLAHFAAAKAVRWKLQAQGRVKVWLVPQAEVKRLAKDYLASHPELYAQAALDPIVQNLAERVRHTDRKIPSYRSVALAEGQEPQSPRAVPERPQVT